ncbi:protein spinster-like isoform X2 [Anopheles merus]|uniref:protein spinster-like isoform X2 n=1 Tax=Anopheles merus TaxID=30066 RepID=UPI001BE4D535|nr:protein spinster-like isoform X2 [Anopheles merus]
MAQPVRGGIQSNPAEQMPLDSNSGMSSVEEIKLQSVHENSNVVTQSNPAEQMPMVSNDMQNTMEEERDRWEKPSDTARCLCFEVLSVINGQMHMDWPVTFFLMAITIHRLKMNKEESIILWLAIVLPYALFAPVFGYLGDRYSRKWIMVLGVLLASMATLLNTFTDSFWWFTTFRVLAGIGQASFSTLAPTIISDMYIGIKRSLRLISFHNAQPFGCFFGIMIATIISTTESCVWLTRVPPVLGAIAVVPIMMMHDPRRGQSEGTHHLPTTSYIKDLRVIKRNRSFICRSWKSYPMPAPLCSESETLYTFFVNFCVFCWFPGPFFANWLQAKNANANPYICAVGLLLSVPLIFFPFHWMAGNVLVLWLLVYFSAVGINSTLPNVMYILLSVVAATRRATAVGFQICISHLIGVVFGLYLNVWFVNETVSDDPYRPSTELNESTLLYRPSLTNTTATEANMNDVINFAMLHYSFQRVIWLPGVFVFIGTTCFLVTACYIDQDRKRVKAEV